MMRIWFTSICVAAMSNLALAQQEPPEFRANFPAGNADWILSFEKRGSNPNSTPTETEKAAATHTIKEIQVSRRGDLRRDIVKYSNGDSDEFWWPGNGQFVLMEVKNKAIAAVKPSILGDRRLDETVFSWIGRGNFKGEETFRGRKCYYFRATVADGADTDTGKKVEKTVEAWLDFQSMQPVAWGNGANLVIFEFKTPPGTEPLVMPAKFRKEYDKWSRYLNPQT